MVLWPTLRQFKNWLLGGFNAPYDLLNFLQFIRTAMRYEVHVPSAPHEGESTQDYGKAWDLCWQLSEEFGYAEIR